MRWQLTSDASAARRRFWCWVTHTGGATTTLFVSVAPLLANGSLRLAAERSLTLLVVSHLVVQVIKRGVSRSRPQVEPIAMRAPDRFSFPSGHAAAATAAALAYASVYPTLTAPLLGAATLVGLSRIVLGVHFPADVVAGQLVTVVSAALMHYRP